MNDMNKTENPKASKNLLAICCALALITAASVAISADSTVLAQTGEGRVSRGLDYPDTGTMLNMYQEARKSGILDDSTYTTSPSQAVLRSAYRYIMEHSEKTAPTQDEVGSSTKPTPFAAFAPIQTKAAATCRSATVDCLEASAKQLKEGINPVTYGRLFACAIASAGRNQDSPKFTMDCSDILDGGNICGAANDLCGIVSTSPIKGSSFVGSTTSYTPKVVSCKNLKNGQDKDRAFQLGFEFANIGGVQRATAVYMQCSSTASQWVGYSSTGGVKQSTSCTNSKTKNGAPEGAKINVQSAGGLSSMTIRCDDPLTSSGTADTYSNIIKGGTSTTTNQLRAECEEGYFVWGVSAYFNDDAPAGQRYIKGLSFLCRK